MNTAVFDGIVREMGEVSTRRNFFRLLGGAAALNAGLAMAAHDEVLGKNRGKSKSKTRPEARERATAQGRGSKKITICFNNQTKLVKKSKLGNFPGATRGACPPKPTPPDPKPEPGPEPEPVACTRWLITGGPNQYDPIAVDDDLMIWQPNRGGHIIVHDRDGKSSSLAPAQFDANVGEILGVRAWDRGGCRSLSQLWVHCLATGQKKKVFPGYSGAGCGYGAGDNVFVETVITVEL
jgi:hypothetical protein